MEFQDELAGGVVLVRPALQSPDYVTGVSGWAIKIDGSAEFNDVVIRGGTTVSGTSLYYDGTPAAGNLVLSIDADGGTDEFGNVYVAGLGVYDADGSQVQIVSGAGAGIYLTPQDVVGTTWHDAKFLTTLGASQRGGLQVISPATAVNNETASFSMFGGGPTTNDSAILFAADRVNFSDDVEIPGEITSYSAWQTFTPTINNTGGATWTRTIGWWKRIDDIYVWEIYLQASGAGSGTTNVTISNMPFDPFRAGSGAGTTRQHVSAHFAAVSAGTNSSVSGAFNILAFAGGAANTLDRITGPTDISFRGEQISSTFIGTIQGWMRAV